MLFTSQNQYIKCCKRRRSQKETGGFRIGESPEQFQQRVKEIQALTKKLTSGKLSVRQVERVRAQLYNLKGLPPDEFRTYEEEFESEFGE